MMRDDSTLSRRTMLQGALLAAGAASLPTLAAERKISIADLANPDDLPRLYAKVRGTLGDELVAYCYNGHVYAMPEEDVPLPICGVIGLSFSRFARQADGTYECRLIERGYYTHPATGEILDTLPNPLTGGIMTPKSIGGRAQAMRIASGGRVIPSIELPAGSSTSLRVWAPRVVEDRVFISEDLMARTPGTGGGVNVLATMSTYSAPLAEVLDPKVKRATTSLHLQSTSTFAPWMAMNNVRGRSGWRVSAVKLKSVDSLDPVFRARLDRDHPDFIQRPGV